MLISTQVILGSFYVHLGSSSAHILRGWLSTFRASGFRISAYLAVGSNPVLQPDVIGHPEIFMRLGLRLLFGMRTWKNGVLHKRKLEHLDNNK